jgi:hypothetical protein
LIPVDNKRVSKPSEKVLESQEQDKEEKLELITPNETLTKNLTPLTKNIEMNQEFDLRKDISSDNPLVIEKKKSKTTKKRVKSAFCHYFFDLQNEDSGIYHSKVKIQKWNGEKTKEGFPIVKSKNATTHLNTFLKTHLEKEIHHIEEKFDNGEDVEDLILEFIVTHNKKFIKKEGDLSKFLTKNEMNQTVHLERDLDWCVTGIMNGWSWNSMASEFTLKHQKDYNGKIYPNRKDLGGYLLSGLYLIVKHLFIESLKDLVGCSITSDGWSGPCLDSFVGLTIHYIKDWKLHSGCLGLVYVIGSKTSTYISRVINQVISDSLPKGCIVGSIVTDGGANFKKAQKIVLEEENSLICISHGTQTCIKSALKNTGNALTEVDKTRDIIKTVKNTSNLRAIVNKTGYITDTETRWDSTYLMLIDFEGNYDKFEKAKDNFDYWIDRSIIRNIIQILQIPYLQTKDLSAENYITVSLVPIYIFKSLKALQPDINDNPFCKNLRANLLKEYQEKFGWILKDSSSKNIYLLSACLDPRFGNLEFVDKTTRDLAWYTLTKT